MGDTPASEQPQGGKKGGVVARAAAQKAHGVWEASAAQAEVQSGLVGSTALHFAVRAQVAGAEGAEAAGKEQKGGGGGGGGRKHGGKETSGAAARLTAMAGAAGLEVVRLLIEANPGELERVLG